MTLAAAFVAAPGPLAADGAADLADQRGLRDALHPAFVQYWGSGDRAFGPELARIVDYWFRFHVIKGAIAALLLIVLVTLGVLLWRAFLRAVGTARAGGFAAAGALVTVFILFALVAVMANIQGALAPFSSLLPIVTEDVADGPLAETLGQITRLLAESPNTSGPTPQALAEMVDDFAWYHRVMAVIAAIVAVSLLGLSAACWIWFARTRATGRRTSGVLASYGVLAVLSAAAMIVVAVANTTVAADPAPALAALFESGW